MTSTTRQVGAGRPQPDGSRHIPTVASQVTRSADSAVMTGTNFSSWWNISQGTMYADFTVPNTSGNYAPFGFNSGSSLFDLVTGNYRFGAVSTDLVTALTNTSNKFAGSYSYLNNATHTASFNNATPVSRINTGMPTIPYINIGSTSYAFILNGYIKKLTYYPVALSNAELQEMTL